MSKAPMVAIIGRPNVGKSSLFNLLLKQRIAIEEETEGVTRDRLILPLEVQGKPCQIVDTGGIGIVDRQQLEQDVNEQIEFAMGSADFIMFLIDGRADLTELDRAVAKKIRQTSVKVLLVANKVDNDSIEYECSKFLSLGFGEVIPISVLHQRGINRLARELADVLPAHKEDDENEGMRIALAGRRNVGKSSLTNYLCGSKRVIVSDMAGTTRDAVDVHLKWGGQDFTLVDTAGLRKKNQTEDSIEFFSVHRTFGALYRSDLGILMIDAEQGISQVDQKLSKWFSDHYKPCIIVVNKWDLAEEKTTKEEYDHYIRNKMPGLAYAPLIYTSVRDGIGIDSLFNTIQNIVEQMQIEVPTGKINDILHEAQEQKRPRRAQGTVAKLFYASQLKKSPPTFLVFGKSTHNVGADYRRYLAQYFRKHLGMPSLPVQFVFKNRTSLYKEA
jgi:GTP-binding protein